MTVTGTPNPEVARELWQEVQDFLSEHPEIVQRLKDKKIAEAVSTQKPAKKKVHAMTAKPLNNGKAAA
jgi:hypothetical protein